MSGSGDATISKCVQLKDSSRVLRASCVAGACDANSSRASSRVSLVDDPRRIMLEKTTIGAPSPLAEHLQRFYDRVARVSDDVIDAQMSDVMQLLAYLEPRVRKLLRAEGAVFVRFVPFGSAAEKTVARRLDSVDVIVELAREKAKLSSPAAGFKRIDLKPHKDKTGSKPDPFRFGRSDDGRFLSPQRVARCLYDAIKRSVKLNEDARIKAWAETKDSNRVGVTLLTSTQTMIDINFTPAFHVASEDCYHVTSRCAAEDCDAHALWRVVYVSREAAIVRRMREADRGVHCSAYVALKALAQVEPTLEGLATEHIRAALLHSFDSSVDSLPRWQRATLVDCFRRLLVCLSDFYWNASLPDFFHNDRDLLAEAPARVVARLRTRLAYLARNEREVLRVLAKRTPHAHDCEGDVTSQHRAADLMQS